MKVLVLNCGSSSLKYQLIDMVDESVKAKGLVDRIGLDNASLSHSPTGKDKYEVKTDIPNHNVAIQLMIDALIDKDHGVIANLSEINAVGHRIVNGSSRYAKPVKIDDSVVQGLKDIIVYAPLHNPPAVVGIEACLKEMPGTPMACVFDTSFHQTMPPKAYTYPIPYEMSQKYDIRRFGAHGSSHRYVAERAATLIGRPAEELKIITCHLGNGSSITAVDGGKCVDTSMGFTPLEGIIMGTRTGSIDAAIVPFLMEQAKIPADEIGTFMNKKCGFLGVSGVSSDLRNVEEAANNGDERAQLSIEIFYYGIVKYIGAYTAVMNGLDAIVFTAGIGENSIATRESVLDKLGFLGVEVDREANNCRGQERLITTANSKVKAYIIPTNEELVIAKDTLAVVKG